METTVQALKEHSVKENSARERILDAAKALFHQQGYNATSFTDIAQAAHIPRGNFYYYFKTKDAILESVIDTRRQELEAKLAEFEVFLNDPHARIKAFVENPVEGEEKIARFGCPVGSLMTEISKTPHSRLQAKALSLFGFLEDWLAQQIVDLGYTQVQADQMAVHLLGRLQGACMLACAHQSRALLQSEIVQLQAWVDTL